MFGLRATVAALLPFLALLLVGCNRGEVAVTFEDVAPAAGFGQRAAAHVLDSVGAGVAVADVDGDGDEDVFVVEDNTTEGMATGGLHRHGTLYRNNDDGSFDDVTEEVGVASAIWVNGGYFVDYDNDGDKDLFVTAWGPNLLFRNDGDGRFVDVAAAVGVQGGATDWSGGAAFGDADFDGDLDLYVTQYCAVDPGDPTAMATVAGLRDLPGRQDRFYRNEGDGTFVDVTAEAGMGEADGRHGLGAVFVDVDNDRDLDIWVVNDSAPEFLWRNDAGRRFVDIAGEVGLVATTGVGERGGPGTDSGDYDGDGRSDLVITSGPPAATMLYRNATILGLPLRFEDVAVEAGLGTGAPDFGWGTRFFDYDNDGWLDLFIANGSPEPQTNRLLRNRGDGTFEVVGPSAGPGLAIVARSRGVAVADFDRNGTLDLFVTNLDAPPNLLLNRGGHNRWLALELIGKTANRDGVGSRVELNLGDRTLVRQAHGSWVHFGLGNVTHPDSLVIHWASGHTDLITGLEAGLFYTIEEQIGVIAESGPRGW